jgi:hypothetical protein
MPTCVAVIPFIKGIEQGNTDTLDRICPTAVIKVEGCARALMPFEVVGMEITIEHSDRNWKTRTGVGGNVCVAAYFGQIEWCKKSAPRTGV